MHLLDLLLICRACLHECRHKQGADPENPERGDRRNCGESATPPPPPPTTTTTDLNEKFTFVEILLECIIPLERRLQTFFKIQEEKGAVGPSPPPKKKTAPASKYKNHSLLVQQQQQFFYKFRRRVACPANSHKASRGGTRRSHENKIEKKLQ